MPFNQRIRYNTGRTNECPPRSSTIQENGLIWPSGLGRWSVVAVGSNLISDFDFVLCEETILTSLRYVCYSGTGSCVSEIMHGATL
jgi:hypothetical protein